MTVKMVSLASQVAELKHLIRSPRLWGKEYLVNSNTRDDPKLGDTRCRHCLVGAAAVVLGCKGEMDGPRHYDIVAKSELSKLLTGIVKGTKIEGAKVPKFTGITLFNDDRAVTHADVMAVCDEAYLHADLSGLMVPAATKRLQNR